MVTPKPANGEEAGDSVVLLCNFLCRQVYSRAPTPWTTFQYMTMMEKAIEHGGDSSAISQEFAPVVYGTIRGHQCAGALITSHHYLQQFFGGGGGQLAHAQIIDDKEGNRSQQFVCFRQSCAVPSGTAWFRNSIPAPPSSASRQWPPRWIGRV